MNLELGVNKTFDFEVNNINAFILRNGSFEPMHSCSFATFVNFNMR